MKGGFKVPRRRVGTGDAGLPRFPLEIRLAGYPSLAKGCWGQRASTVALPGESFKKLSVKTKNLTKRANVEICKYLRINIRSQV